VTRNVKEQICASSIVPVPLAFLGETGCMRGIWVGEQQTWQGGLILATGVRMAVVVRICMTLTVMLVDYSLLTCFQFPPRACLVVTVCIRLGMCTGVATPIIGRNLVFGRGAWGGIGRAGDCNQQRQFDQLPFRRTKSRNAGVDKLISQQIRG
jgi:hypothetical protein